MKLKQAIINDRKGQTGYEFVKITVGFVAGLGILVIFALILAGNVAQTGDNDIITFTILNETFDTGTALVFINSSGYTLSNETGKIQYDFTITNVKAGNSTTAEYNIPLANVTVDATTGNVTNATATQYQSTNGSSEWRINISYTYHQNSQAGNIVSNISAGGSSLMGSSGMWLTLVGLIMIIIIFAVAYRYYNMISEGRGAYE